MIYDTCLNWSRFSWAITVFDDDSIIVAVNLKHHIPCQFLVWEINECHINHHIIGIIDASDLHIQDWLCLDGNCLCNRNISIGCSYISDNSYNNLVATSNSTSSKTPSINGVTISSASSSSSSSAGDGFGSSGVIQDDSKAYEITKNIVENGPDDIIKFITLAIIYEILLIIGYIWKETVNINDYPSFDGWSIFLFFCLMREDLKHTNNWFNNLLNTYFFYQLLFLTIT